MNTLEFNWKKIEEAVNSVAPDKYEMLSRKQIMAIEEKISKGVSPVIQAQQAGGMHMNFVAAMNVVANLMLAAAIISIWYDYARPIKEETTYSNFLKACKEDPKLPDFLMALLTQEILRFIERLFDQIIEAFQNL